TGTPASHSLMTVVSPARPPPTTTTRRTLPDSLLVTLLLAMTLRYFISVGPFGGQGGCGETPSKDGEGARPTRRVPVAKKTIVFAPAKKRSTPSAPHAHALARTARALPTRPQVVMNVQSDAAKWNAVAAMPSK